MSRTIGIWLNRVFLRHETIQTNLEHKTFGSLEMVDDVLDEILFFFGTNNCINDTGIVIKVLPMFIWVVNGILNNFVLLVIRI